MADTKISALTALTGANVDIAADILPIVDTSVTTTKKILVSELLKSFHQPTIQVFTSGTAQTYTTPANATHINVRMVGGGGGGAGASANNGANGVDTTFGTLTASKGIGGSTNSSVGGAGGTGTNGDFSIQGSAGGDGSNDGGQQGGAGGCSAFFGGGGARTQSLTSGQNAVTNSGGGGSGGGGSGPTGGGGGGGGSLEKLIIGPSATYTYTVGTGGAGGAAGGNGGGNGAAGIIIVYEFYN